MRGSRRAGMHVRGGMHPAAVCRHQAARPCLISDFDRYHDSQKSAMCAHRKNVAKTPHKGYERTKCGYENRFAPVKVSPRLQVYMQVYLTSWYSMRRAAAPVHGQLRNRTVNCENSTVHSPLSFFCTVLSERHQWLQGHLVERLPSQA